MTAVLTAEQWAPIRDAVMEYGNHFAEAALHQSSSKADISHASALSALRKVRDSIDALLALVQPAVSEEAPGWVTVPNTATHNMLNAANAGRKKGRSSSGDIYRAMIEAAPKLSAQSSKGDEGMQHE